MCLLLLMSGSARTALNLRESTPTPSVVDLVLRQLGESVHKFPNILNVFIFTKLMIPVLGIMLFKRADLAVYGPPGAKC